MAETGSLIQQLHLPGFIFQNALVRQDLEGSLIPGPTPGLVTSGFKIELLEHHFTGAGGEKERLNYLENNRGPPLFSFGDLRVLGYRTYHSCPFADTW